MKLSKDRGQTVEFTIEVEGTSENCLPRLVLNNHKIALMLEGKMSGNTAIFEVPKLDKLFEEDKEVDGEVEVLVENRYFKPWKSLIEFENPITVKVNERIEPKITGIRVEPLAVKKESPKPEANKPFSFKNKEGKMEEVFVLNVVEQKDNSLLLEVVDENQKKRKFTIKKKK